MLDSFILNFEIRKPWVLTPDFENRITRFFFLLIFILHRLIYTF